MKEKQNVLKYIPIIQLITIFYWIKGYASNNLKWKDFAKSFFLMLFVMLLIHIPRMILSFVFENIILNDILFYISLYPTFSGLSLIAVADQKKHGII